MLHFKKYFLNSIVGSDLWTFEQRLKMYYCFGLIGKNIFINSDVKFSRTDLSNVLLGDRTFLNVGCYLDNAAEISIGDNTCLAPYVKLLTTSHVIGDSDRRVGNTAYSKAIHISEGCWIGANSVVLPGVTIGRGTVIGANSLVTKDCEANCMYFGSPARLVKRLPERTEIML